MSVTDKIQARIDREDERIRNLEADVPKLRERFEMAEAHADQVEASLLMNEAVGGVMHSNGDVTDETLRRAKVAESQRRRALEQAERELRLARILRSQLEQTAEEVAGHDVDGKLARLDERVPKVAERLADAWQTYLDAAEEADEVRREHRRLKALVPVKGIPVSLTNRVPRFPAFENLRAKRPHESMRHPVSVLRSLGYTELASRLAEGR